MADYRDDKSKYRTLVSGTHDNYTGTYNIDDKIGRQSGVDAIAVSTATASGVIELLPTSPLGRRNYIKVYNNGPDTVEIHASTASGSIGYPVASGVEWEEYSDAIFYMKSTGTSSVLTVYERASRGNVNDTL